MQLLVLDDPEWLTTFPRRIAPLEDEGLWGWFLRCDEINAWGQGTTLNYLLRATRGHPGVSASNFILGTHIDMTFLARLLALPESTLIATTYTAELARLYGTAQPNHFQLTRNVRLRFCPECMRQSRLVRRTFLLPQITSCPVHHLILVERCSCPPSPLSRTMLVPPFVCDTCKKDWGDLPCVAADPARILLEKECLFYYLFFCNYSEGLCQLQKEKRTSKVGA